MHDVHAINLCSPSIYGGFWWFFFEYLHILCNKTTERFFIIYLMFSFNYNYNSFNFAFIIINVSMSMIYVLPYKTFIASHDKAQGKIIVKFKHPVQKLYFIKDQHLNLKIMNIWKKWRKINSFNCSNKKHLFCSVFYNDSEFKGFLRLGTYNSRIICCGS